MEEETLKAKTSKGLFWGGTSSFVQQLLNAAFGIYLARNLSPDDYGLVGMLAIFSLLAIMLTEFGFHTALINEKEFRHEDYNAVFWFNIIVASSCAISLFVSAPAIALFFHHEELVAIARWYSLGFILTGFGPVQNAYLSRELMIREKAIVALIAVIISGSVGVIFAWKGLGYWALVAQSLILNFLSNLGMWICSRWRPTLQIDFRPVAKMLRFSMKLVLTNVLSIFGTNFITVILGRYYPALQVGYYTNANKWNGMGTSVLSGMLGSVAQPVLSRIVDDRERQLRVFRKMMRFAAFVSFPAMLGLAFVAPEFITIALTDKWANSIPLLQILCVGGSFAAMINLCSGLIISHGRSDQFLWANVIISVSLILVTFACFPLGIVWMVGGISIVTTMSFLVWVFFAHIDIGYCFRDLLSDIFPFLGASIVSISIAWLITQGIENIVLALVLKILITAVVYVIIMKITASATFKDVFLFIKDRFNID